MVTRNRAISMAEKADEEEEEEWCCSCSWQTWLAIAWFSKTDPLITNGDLATQTYIATSCQRMRKPLSFTQCGQAAAARLTISSMLHIYPHAPGGGGLSVQNFATTTIESWTGTNLLFKLCNNIFRNYFVAIKKKVMFWEKSSNTTYRSVGRWGLSKCDGSSLVSEKRTTDISPRRVVVQHPTSTRLQGLRPLHHPWFLPSQQQLLSVSVSVYVPLPRLQTSYAHFHDVLPWY